MSFAGKVFWLTSILSFMIMFFARVYIGGWMSIMYVPLATSLIALIAAFVIDIKYYAEVLTLRTTKYGINVGLSFVIFAVILVSLNVISVQMDSSFDLSSHKINSLTPEDIKVLEQVDENILISVYHRGSKDKVSLMQIKQMLNPFLAESNKIKTNFINIYKESLKAKIELKGIPDDSKTVVLLRYKDKKIKVDHPVNNLNVSKALVQATRVKNKSIYFVNTNKRSLNDDQDDGLLGLSQVLSTKGFEIKSFNLSEPVNSDTHPVIAVIGNKSEWQPKVIKLLVDYVSLGGKLLVAVDPVKENKVNDFVKEFGFVFQNNFIISEVGQKIGRSPTTAMGVVFTAESKITSPFRESKQSYALFETASEIRVKKSKAYDNFKYFPLIATPKQSFSVSELKLKLTPGKLSAKTLAVLAKNNKEGEVLLFGDSDFLTNKDLLQGVNKQLALNSFSYLAGEFDLINEFKDKVNLKKKILTDRLRNSIVVAGFMLPFLLFLMSGLLFYKNKGA